MAGVGDMQALGYPDLNDPDYRCWFPIGVPWFTVLGRAPILAVDFNSAFLLGFAVRVCRWDYDINITPGPHIIGSGSFAPMRIDAVTPPSNENWLPFCTLFSSVILDPNFTLAGWSSDSYDPATKLFFGTVFLETASGLTTSSLGTVATSVVGDAYGFAFTVYATPGVVATGFFTLSIDEYWQYKLADGTICRDAITGNLTHAIPPSGL